ncbi:hypothetical protein KBC89_00260 [Candidatus Woesebacteria bacterium]|nr:hypothetical protein [Candidatus Woesebacteria bacterium]
MGCHTATKIHYFLILVDWGFLKGQITNYPVMCPSDFDGCYTLRHTTYKVDEKNNKVIYWTEGFPPSTVTDCSIISRTNRKCAYDDGSAEFGFSEGSHFDYSPSFSNDNTSYASRLTYLMFHWGLKKYL